MGDTTARYFRDKLAMRTRAKEEKIPVPDFVHILNYRKINEFAAAVPFPYLIKPRLQAGAHGIKKISSSEELWHTINGLGDEQSFYLLERFVEGDIYHVDSIIYNMEVRFAVANQYSLPPFEVAHEGRVFGSRTVKHGTPEEEKLIEINRRVMKAMGLVRGVSHTEFIKSKDDGSFYFLETSARVGGANIAELVEAAAGINLWAEWAKIELWYGKREYKLPPVKNDYAGIIISLAKQEWPDLSGFNDTEVVWRMKKKNHAGLIISSPDHNRIESLLKKYTERFYNDFFATHPIEERPVN
jgi:biotin carboxylase